MSSIRRRMRKMRISESFSNVDDKAATDIEQALASTENVHVNELALTLSERLTVSGAQAIAHGLKQSQIKKLNIKNCGKRNGNELYYILVEAIVVQRIQDVSLGFLNNDTAKLLGSILISSNHHALQTLKISIGHNMTMDAAQRLAVGLRHAKVKCVVLAAGSSSVIGTSTIRIAPMQSVVQQVLLAVLESVESFEFNSMTDETTTEIGNALVGNTTLHSFKFVIQESLSIDAAERLADGISLSHISHLNMSNSSLNDKKLSADVEDASYEGVARSPSICHLSIGVGFSGTAGLAQSLSRLHTLELAHSVVVKDVPALMMGLRNAPHLSTLVIGQRLTAQNISTVCAALPHLTSLTNLTMKCKLAVDEQQQDHHHQQQQEADDVEPLALKLQHVHATGAEQLMMAVANHPSLVYLNLDQCSDIGFAGLVMIGAHLPNTKLKSLSLSYFHDDKYNNPPLDGCCVQQQQAFLRACQALVAGVKSNWYLQVLTLKDDFLSKVIRDVSFHLYLNKSGRYLLLRDTGDSGEKLVPMGLWCHVLAKCGNEASLMFYNLQEQPGLLLTAGAFNYCKPPPAS